MFVVSDNYFVRSAEAAASPVLNFKNEITMVITFFGGERALDLTPDSAMCWLNCAIRLPIFLTVLALRC